MNIIYVYIFGENDRYSTEQSYSNLKMTQFEVKSVENHFFFHFFEGYSQCYLTVSSNRELVLTWGPNNVKSRPGQNTVS